MIEKASEFVHIVFPFLWLDFINWSYMIFSMGQRDMLILLASTVSGVIVYGVCMVLFYIVFDFGYTGVCWANALMFVGRFAGTLIYLKVKEKNFTYFDDVHLFSKETVANLGPLLNLSINAMLMNICPKWSLSLINIMAAYYGTL